MAIILAIKVLLHTKHVIMILMNHIHIVLTDMNKVEVIVIVVIEVI